MLLLSSCTISCLSMLCSICPWPGYKAGQEPSYEEPRECLLERVVSMSCIVLASLA